MIKFANISVLAGFFALVVAGGTYALSGNSTASVIVLVVLFLAGWVVSIWVLTRN